MIFERSRKPRSNRLLIAGCMLAPTIATAQLPPVPAVGDGAFPGTIALSVDATDVDHRIMKVT